MLLSAFCLFFAFFACIFDARLRREQRVSRAVGTNLRSTPGWSTITRPSPEWGEFAPQSGHKVRSGFSRPANQEYDFWQISAQRIFPCE